MTSLFDTSSLVPGWVPQQPSSSPYADYRPRRGRGMGLGSLKSPSHTEMLYSPGMLYNNPSPSTGSSRASSRRARRSPSPSLSRTTSTASSRRRPASSSRRRSHRARKQRSPSRSPSR